MTPIGDDERGRREALGKAIRLRRVELDLSRSDLAREADVSYTYVSEIENGTKQASSKTLWRIARAVGLEPHELLASAAQWSAGLAAAGAAAGGAVRGRGPRAAAPEPERSGWFHAGGSPSERPAATGAAASAAATPELAEVLERIAAALEGAPDERAELALMLSLDERRTRRIVRDELDRRRLRP